MENSQHVKSFNVDSRVKNRFRFSSSKQKSKSVSADIYRSFKRQYGVTSAADREESVHRPKRLKSESKSTDLKTEALDRSCTFAEELELANDRNGSELFSQLYRELWPLVRSIPELLHHSKIVVNLLLSYLLSPKLNPHEKTMYETSEEIGLKQHFIVNHATTDIMHLLTVLAKDLQQEVHPFVYTKIIPRIVTDLLNPPPPIDSAKQDVPLDVLVIETSFRSLSYIFQHDAEMLITESKKDGEEPCLEQMRKFYGQTLGHKRDVVRRLAAETFAPLIRKLKTDGARKRHLRRVLRALVKSDSGQEEQSKVTKQAQMNATDGISLFLFEIAKGAAGRIHSKGHLIIRYVLDFVSEYGHKHSSIITPLASSFLQKIYNHIRNGMESAFDSTWEEIIRFRNMEHKSPDSKGALICFILLIQEAVEYHDGYFFTSNEDASGPHTDERLKSIMAIVDDLTIPSRLLSSSQEVSRSCINLLYITWNLISIDGGDDSLFQTRLNDILNSCRKNDSKKLILIVEVFLEATLGTNAKWQALPTILSSISKLIEGHREQSRILLFRVVQMFSLEANEKEDFDTFSLVSYSLSDTSIEKDVCISLLDLCVDTKSQTITNKTGLVSLTFAATCIPFLCSATKKEPCYNNEKQYLKWILDHIGLLISSQKKVEPDYQQIVPIALLVDAFSRVVASIQPTCQFSWLKKLVSSCASHSWTLVKMYPQSLWVMKSAASLCRILSYCDMRIHDDIHTVFEVLLPNLRNENHYQRLHSLQILNSYPQLPYIVNHADIDYSDDLDEEQGYNPVSNRETSGLKGCCDVIDTLLKIESTKANVETERGITAMISRVGLISKSGRLPVIYAEALANHLVGIFHLKYSSLWSAASGSLCALSKEYHPILCNKISDVLDDLLSPIIDQAQDATSTCPELFTHYNLCVAWDLSKGRDTRLFQQKITLDSENGVVSPFLSTDRETVLHEVLKVIQAVPEITAKHSRRIVPMFVAFLQSQYYLFHNADPVARELKLDKHFQAESKWEKDMLNRKMLNQRLLSFLNVFAEVKGSQQLFQRSLLLSIFTAFLSHQDAQVAKVALRCTVNFTSPRFDKYSDKFKDLLKQDGLRDALLMIPLSPESDVIQSDDREQVVQIVLRILFGRLSASSTRGKKSKDSTSARRKAIVSSLSQLKKKELFPLVYLMLRNYTPKEFDLKWEEVGMDSYMDDFLRVTSVQLCCNFIEMPIQWHEGFLNLLSNLISQLKRSLSNYVPSFFSVLIEIIKCTAFRDSEQLLALHQNNNTDEVEGIRFSQRVRSVRSHAIRCTATLMDDFAPSIEFAPRLPSVWKGISPSVENLPSDVAQSNSMPSVLNLLLVLASHTDFHSILKSQPSAIDSVIKCIGPTSNDVALNTTLDFILHLLGIDFESGSEDILLSENLSNAQIYLILKQFKERFEDVLNLCSGDASSNLKKITVKTLAKELFVLRMVGDLMLKKDDPGRGELQQELFDSLSSLLLSLMDHPRFQEEDYVNVLKTVFSLLPKVSEGAANSCFFSLSKLLKYENWNRLSPLVRREVSSTMRSISLRKDSDIVFERISQVIENLFAINPKRIDEMDYGRVLPALSELSKPEGKQSWSSLTNMQGDQNNGKVDVKVLSSVSHACLSLMQQDDVVVSRSAFTALRSLVRIVSDLQLEEASEIDVSWSKFMESCLVPGVRMALRSPSDQIRRHSLSLIRETSIGFQNSSSPNLHGDMSILACEENSDLDFYANILHVQTHRRCRALQRLRARLNEVNGESGTKLTTHSISNILVPLVLQPIYECKTNLQEEFAQECVATVGALSRHLTWKKYHDVLWTALNQLSRHQSQEKLLIGMICAILDSFHFELITDSHHNTAVRRTLEKRVIPKVEALLVKEKRDQAGGKSRILRPNIVLAVLKLLRKFPTEYFESQLPRLLATVCDALKNKDSNIREKARKTFGAIIIEVGPEYLSGIVNTLAVTLHEGFRLHVRMATLHHVLHALSGFHKPTESLSVFDECIPTIMDLILQDMFGVANETKDNTDAAKKLVKEATGSKSYDAIEIVCRLLYFDPSKLSSNKSSIHFVVAPLFQKLTEEDVQTKTISKIKSCLSRVVAGISQNPSAKLETTLEFVFASISPILQLSKEVQIKNGGSKDELKQMIVVWEPSSSGIARNAKAALLKKKADNANLKGVIDGFSAPKLTGSNRHSQRVSKFDLNDPTNTCAIEFGLNLLFVKMKNSSHLSADVMQMLTPFLDILTICLCQSRENSVSILSVRCIALLLKRRIKPTDKVLDPLGTKIIEILSSGEAIIGSNQEMVHTCLVALTILLKMEKAQSAKKNKHVLDRDGQGQKNLALTLSDEKMGIVVSIVKESLMHSDSTNSPLDLIKALLSTKFVSPDFYDLMENLLDFSVRSHRESFRDQCSNLFVEFLIHYPLTRNRLEQHLRQVMLNIKYEYKEGRLSAIRLVSILLERFPLKLIDEELQLFFLPLVLQISNDEAEECRKLVSECLTRLICRVSTNVALSLFDYLDRWHKGTNMSLRRASLQVFGIFAEGRSDFKSQYQTKVMEYLRITFEELKSNWQDQYFALVSLEKIIKKHPKTLSDENGDIWAGVISAMLAEHSWVKLTASRIVWAQVATLDPTTFQSSAGANLFLKQGTMYEIASTLCLNLDTEDLSIELTEITIKLLTWLSRAMSNHPELCYKSEGRTSANNLNEEASPSEQKPLKWLLTRLSNMSKHKGSRRRQAIFKCFAAIVHTNSDNLDVIIPYLELMLEPLNRSFAEAEGTKDYEGNVKYSDESDLAREVLGLLEESCGDEYLVTLAKVKEKARHKRDMRKDQQKMIVADPMIKAKNKIQKQIREKQRRKRRVQERRNDRGGSEKRRHL